MEGNGHLLRRRAPRDCEHAHAWARSVQLGSARAHLSRGRSKHEWAQVGKGFSLEFRSQEQGKPRVKGVISGSL